MIINALHKLKSTTRIVLAISLITTIQFVYVAGALAIQTNVNKVTDLFDKHIEDKDALLNNLKAQNNNAISEINSKAGVNSIEGINEAEGKAAELNGIKETDLDNAGRGKRASEEYRFYDESELEPDYTKSGNSEHKLDSDDIISLTNTIRRCMKSALILWQSSKMKVLIAKPSKVLLLKSQSITSKQKRRVRKTLNMIRYSAKNQEIPITAMIQLL